VSAFEDLLRPGLRDLPPYRLVEETAPVKLSQNESPFDIPPELKREALDRAGKRPWNRYAQEVPNRVVKLLSELNKWPEEGIVLAAGSNLLLELLGLSTIKPGSTALAPAPCFALYRLITAFTEGRYVEIPFAKNFIYDSAAWVDAAEKYRPALIFLCTPNNPTGSFMGREGVEAVASASKGLVVVDEAYREFAGEDRRDILPQHPNMVLVRTFSKAFGAAGIRLGYMLAHPPLAEQIRKAVPPFNINVLTATVAEVLLENHQVIIERVRYILRERERVIAVLRSFPEVEVFPTRGNFFLLRTPYESSTVAEALRRLGVAVRVLSGAGLERCVRVNVGTEEENDRFLSALKEVLLALSGRA